jgi:hypothetical protein
MLAMPCHASRLQGLPSYLRHKTVLTLALLTGCQGSICGAQLNNDIRDVLNGNLQLCAILQECQVRTARAALCSSAASDCPRAPVALPSYRCHCKSGAL